MSFINPYFLMATGAALLPVIYHFVRKTQARTVPFSSLMLLKNRQEELVKRRRLRDLLLMAVRAALFGLLALAFARPLLPEEQAAAMTGPANQSVVVLLDNSYSLQYQDGLERVRSEALGLLGEARPGDEFAVLAFSDEVEQLTELGSDLTRHREAVENRFEASHRTTDYYQPLHLAAELLRDARYEKRRIVLVSDLQRGGWDRAPEGWRLPDGVTFEPISVAPREPDNTYIDAVELSRRRAGAQAALRFDGRIASVGPAAEQDKEVQLIVEDQIVDQRQVPGRSARRVSFQHTADQGAHRSVIALAADDLPVDDRYYLTYQVEGQPEIFVVDGSHNSEASDAFFLQKAFDMGENARFDFTAAGPESLRRSLLPERGAVFISNTTPSPGEQDMLLRYVEEGGSLVISFGDAYDEGTVAAWLEALGLGHAQEALVPSAPVIIGQVDGRHPVFEPFNTSGGGGIWRPEFRRYVRIEPDPDAAVLGAYDSGDPFLLERGRGSGKALAYTSSFGTSWTDFPLHEGYVPFLYQLAAYAAQDARARRVFTVGETVPLPGQDGDAWDVQAPDGRQHKVEVAASGVGFFQEAHRPGHYLAARGDERFAFSVNVDPRESDLSFWDEEEAYAAVAPSGEAADQAVEAGPRAMSAADVEGKQQFWKYLVGLVLVLFAVETMMANRLPGTLRKRSS